MRQLMILFFILFGSFLGVWIYKIETPVNRPDEYADGVSATAGQWWTTTSVEVDDSWKLDPEIPLNYIPVPGEDELYMVIDNDGNITGYRHRTKQIDGSWLWEDVNPDIPENYEAVEGLEDVYKVTYDDGTVQYFKYIRNDDDTFAFVEVDENGNPIGRDTDATVIDGKHVLISGNTYALLNDNGVVIGYETRTDNGDGTFMWIDTDLPELTDISSLYGDYSLGDGITTNPDAFDTTLDAGDISVGIGDNSVTNQYDITINYDDNGGYYTDDGTYVEGSSTDDSALEGGGISDNSDAGLSDSDLLTSLDDYDLSSPTLATPEMPEVTAGLTASDGTPTETTVIQNDDGTHTEVETVKETKNIDGVTYTYETYVKKTYDAAGNLISTISDGPYETAEQQNLTQETNPVQSISVKESTLSGELARVAGSYSYNMDLANEVFALLNAQRASQALPALTSTDEAQTIAELRAADMAGYDTSDEVLPTYGSLTNMMSEYSVSSNFSGDNMWKSIEHTADEIHTRFQALDSAREVRMSSDATSYGLAIVEKNGYYYICEVIL